MSVSIDKQLEKKTCHDCAAKPGSLHNAGCDVERCPECGGQIISCRCFHDETWPKDADRLPWTGIWPGVIECIEFGWYSKWVENSGPGPLGKWVSCSKDDLEAGPDLNRLSWCARWDRKLKRWVLP